MRARRAARVLALGAMCALPLSGLGTACRAVAGIDSDLSYEPSEPTDAARDARDVGRDAPLATDAPSALCLPPEVLFTTPNVLDVVGTIVLAPDIVYVDVFCGYSVGGQCGVAANGAPFSGLLACPKSGCGRTPSALFGNLLGDAGSTLEFAGAYASSESLYLAVASQAPLENGQYVPGFIDVAGFDGGGVRTLIGGLTYPEQMATTSNAIVWLDDPAFLSSADVDAGWSVYACPLSGCDTPETLMVDPTDQAPLDFFADEGSAYVVSEAQSSVAGVYGSTDALDADVDDATPNEILSNLSEGDAGDGGAYGAYIAGDGTYVYVEYLAAGIVERLKPSSGETTLIAQDQAFTQDLPAGQGSTVGNIVVDSTFAYWAVAGGDVMRAKKDGSGGLDRLACNVGTVIDLEIDQTSLYLLIVDVTGAKPTSISRVTLP